MFHPTKLAHSVENKF